MKRSSISIWKHARFQFDDLPACPDDLSELNMQNFHLEKLVPSVLFYFFRGHSSLIPLSIAIGALHPTLSFGPLELGLVPDVYLKSTSFCVPSSEALT